LYYSQDRLVEYLQAWKETEQTTSAPARSDSQSGGPDVESDSESEEDVDEEEDQQPHRGVGYYLIDPAEHLVSEFKSAMATPVKTQGGTIPLGWLLVNISISFFIFCPPRLIVRGATGLARDMTGLVKGGLMLAPCLHWAHGVKEYLGPAFTQATNDTASSVAQESAEARAAE